jgi:hypothetical protein
MLPIHVDFALKCIYFSAEKIVPRQNAEQDPLGPFDVIRRRSGLAISGVIRKCFNPV